MVPFGASRVSDRSASLAARTVPEMKRSPLETVRRRAPPPCTATSPSIAAVPATLTSASSEAIRCASVGVAGASAAVANAAPKDSAPVVITSTFPPGAPRPPDSTASPPVASKVPWSSSVDMPGVPLEPPFPVLVTELPAVPPPPQLAVASPRASDKPSRRSVDKLPAISPRTVTRVVMVEGEH